jgi:hypothetical protein
MVEQKAPWSRWHRHAESGTFSHLRSSLGASVVLPHHGLADAIEPDQISTNADAAKLLRSDGRATELRVAVFHVIVCEISS